MRNTLCFVVFASSAVLTFSAERVTATGRILDSQGSPVEHATVLVYSAAVKKGYNLYCPTCYVDCGKRSISDAEGNFTITGLNADLHFNLLVARDGYGPKMIEKVDPTSGEAKATLDKRVPVDDPAQVARGRIVDSEGKPVRDALIEQHGAIFTNGGRMFGPRDWIDLIAVSNEQGEFELANKKPLRAAILQVSPRGMASKLVTVSTGGSPKSITVFDGAVVRGRLLKDGKPVAKVQVGLVSHDHNSQSAIPEVRIGTDENGRFAFTNVPAGRVFDLFGKMESLAPLGWVAEMKEIATKDNGQEIDAGDIAVRNAFTLRGKVVLTDGKPIPPKTRINIAHSRHYDNQTAELSENGSFEFSGLGRGVYTLTPSVRGYETDDGLMYMEVLIEGNIDNLRIVLRRPEAN